MSSEIRIEELWGSVTVAVKRQRVAFEVNVCFSWDGRRWRESGVYPPEERHLHRYERRAAVRMARLFLEESTSWGAR